LNKRNKGAIQKDHEDGVYDTVGVYLEHHLAYIEGELLDQLVDLSNSSVDPAIQLMKTLHLIRVGLYPDNEDMFATFDYSLGKDLTNYLIVIDTDEDGNISNMTMES
jgi:hypothetical protein